MQPNDTALPIEITRPWADPWPAHVPLVYFHRFRVKVIIPGDLDDCFIWTAGKREGYGAFRLDGKAVGAHIVAHAWFVAPNPNGLFVCHNCIGGGNRDCVNPRHLSLGTPQQNMDFAAENGRIQSGGNHWSHRIPELRASGDRHGAYTHPESRVRGERSGAARLTETSVREIRRLYALGDTTLDALAQKHNVCYQNIWMIVKRKTWQHIE